MQGKIMTWSYRVMERNNELAIYSVYYDENGEVVACSKEPTPPIGKDLEDLKDEMSRYLTALEKPILKYEDKLS